MSGREHSIPAVRVSSGTTTQRGNFSDVSMGHIMYNTTDRQLQVYHHENGQSPGWENVILTPHLNGTSAAISSLQTQQNTTDTSINSLQLQQNQNTTDIAVNNTAIGNCVKTTNVNQSINGVKTFGVLPRCNATPTTTTELTTKSYVDTQIASGVAGTKIRLELYTNNGTTQTINGGDYFKYLTYNQASLIRGSSSDITYQFNSNLYKSSIRNNTNGRKRFFFRCFTGHATGGTYFDFIAYSNQYSSASYLNYTVGHNTIRGTGPSSMNGVRKLIAGTTGTHDSMNIGQQLMDLNNGNSSLDRRAITGIIEVEPYHYIHIQVRKNGSQSVVGLSSNFRADCYGLLYFFEL